MSERIQLPMPVRFGKTVNPLSRIDRWEHEKGLPPCPPGATIWVEIIEALSSELLTADALQKAYLDGSDAVLVVYRQASGNQYSCYFSELSLGEAGIILQAIGAAEPGESNTDRHVTLMNEWAANFRERIEKEFANRVQ